MGKTLWRVILSEQETAPWNMALDEAIFTSFYEGKIAPTLRFYSWKRAVSFGRFQESSEIKKLQSVEYVRRMTGGGAILHKDEITYSLVCGKKHLPGIDNVKESYFFLTEFILQTYRSLGLLPLYAKDYYKRIINFGKPQKNPICFEGLEPYDILIDGKKIGGNAQLRRGNMVFQHGSLPLLLDRELTAAIFGKQSSDLRSMSSLHELGVNIDFNSLRSKLLHHFSATTSSQYVIDLPTQAEIQKTYELSKNKYSDNNWTWERSYTKE